MTFLYTQALCILSKFGRKTFLKCGEATNICQLLSFYQQKPWLTRWIKIE